MENRCRYDRRHLRYESDLTEAEWGEIGPLIPGARPRGNERTVNIRQVTNGVMYILSTGCRWRAIPKDLPPSSAVHDYLVRWTYDGTLERVRHALYVKCREQAVWRDNQGENGETSTLVWSRSRKANAD